VTDPPLSDLGRSQARRVAALLADRPLVRVLSSDLKRAVETADLIAARHMVVVETSTALREIDFGKWEGRNLGDLWLEDSAAALAWERDVRQTPRAFGENVGELERRVAAFWERAGLLDGGEVAIVGHGGSLGVLRALITREPFAGTIAWRLGFGEMVGLDA
jgi:probable phosphoglycerate mutase